MEDPLLWSTVNYRPPNDSDSEMLEEVYGYPAVFAVAHPSCSGDFLILAIRHSFQFFVGGGPSSRALYLDQIHKSREAEYLVLMTVLKDGEMAFSYEMRSGKQNRRAVASHFACVSDGVFLDARLEAGCHQVSSMQDIAAAVVGNHHLVHYSVGLAALAAYSTSQNPSSSACWARSRESLLAVSQTLAKIHCRRRVLASICQ